MTMLKLRTSFLFCLGTLVLCQCSLAINPVGTSTDNQDYFDLANNTDDFLAVGLVSVPGASCSGAWIGDDLVLTARHCGGGPDNITFTFPNGTSIGSINHWPSNVGPNDSDLAIVQLAETPNVPSNYVPGKIRENNNGVVGQIGTMVGYGGIGRSAGNNTITLAGNTGEIQAVRPNAAALELGSNLIPGDSGGPLFVEETDGSYSIVGVAAVIFGNLDIWSNPVAYHEQIEFGRQTNNFSFFQDGLPVPQIMGDTNQDLVVNQADISNFVTGWKQDHSSLNATQSWLRGDFNGDNTTDLEDAFILHQALQDTGFSISLEALIVPEPVSAQVLAGCLALFFSCGRCRKQ